VPSDGYVEAQYVMHISRKAIVNLVNPIQLCTRCLYSVLSKKVKRSAETHKHLTVTRQQRRLKVVNQLLPGLFESFKLEQEQAAIVVADPLPKNSRVLLNANILKATEFLSQQTED